MIKYTTKFLNEFMTAPEYKSAGAAGFDLQANVQKDYVIYPGVRELIGTGLSVELPKHFHLEIRPRSGLAITKGITVVNSPGTVDSDYRGEVAVGLINLSNQPFTIEPGMRIAQAVLTPSVITTLEEVDKLSETARGSGGFGSTGL